MEQQRQNGKDLFGEIMEAERRGTSWQPYGNDDPTKEPTSVAQPIRDLSPRGRKRLIWGAVGAACVLAVLMYFFPVYRLTDPLLFRYFTPEERQMLAIRGTPWDLWEAREIMALGRAAFEDISTPRAELEAKHDALWRYAIEKEAGMESVDYSLKLLSAHLGKDSGYVWVEYSHEGFKNGSSYTGTMRISYRDLWIVNRDATGAWQVIDTKWST